MADDDRAEELQAKFGRSEGGKFYPIDTMGIPHLYCIGSRHVVHASDHFGGMLGEAAIESAEKAGVKCGMRGCTLSYKQHEKALLIACDEPLTDHAGKAHPELHAYLLKIKEQATAEGFAGFAFLDRTKGADGG